MDHTQQHAQALPSEWCAGLNHDRACEGNTAGCCGTRFCGTCGDFVAGVCALPVQCCGDRSDEAGTCGTGKDGSSANGTGAGPARDAVRGTGRIAAVASIGYAGATRNSPAITGSSLSAYAA